MARQNKTGRETYSRLIGYNFGQETFNGRTLDRVYDGAFWDTETGRKQYMFGYYEPHTGERFGHYLTDYKGFREIIDQYDWPRR